MKPPLVDTDILIDALRGLPPAIRWLREQAAAGALFASVITRAELVGGVRPKEEERWRVMAAALEWVPVDERIADQGGIYRRVFLKSHQLAMPDALIAATARVLDATLVTLNRKHFPMTDIDILVPYGK